MDRRTLLALLLTAIVIVVTPMLFPSSRRAPPRGDTLRVSRGDTVTRPQVPVAAAITTPPSVVKTGPAASPARAETTIVHTNRAVYSFVSPGGSPAVVTLPEYHSLRSDARQMPVNLIDAHDRLVSLRLATETDTIALDTIAFRAVPQTRDGGTIVQSLSSASSPGIRVSRSKSAGNSPFSSAIQSATVTMT